MGGINISKDIECAQEYGSRRQVFFQASQGGNNPAVGRDTSVVGTYLLHMIQTKRGSHEGLVPGPYGYG